MSATDQTSKGNVGGPKLKREIYASTEDGHRQSPPQPAPMDVSAAATSTDEEDGLDGNHEGDAVLASWQPSNPFVTPMLTDFYQLTMVYAYWKGGRQDDHSVFELFFRKN